MVLGDFFEDGSGAGVPREIAASTTPASQWFWQHRTGQRCFDSLTRGENRRLHFSRSVQKDFFFAKKSFCRNSSPLAGVYQTIRMGDGIRALCVLDAHDVIQPGLLPHGVYVDIFTAKLFDDCQSSFVVRTGQAAGMSLLSVKSLFQSKTANPRHWPASAFHAK